MALLRIRTVATALMPRATWDVEIVAFVAEHDFRAHLRGLKKRGFTDEEIINIASKAGLKVTEDILTAKPKKLKVGATEIPYSARTSGQQNS